MKKKVTSMLLTLSLLGTMAVPAFAAEAGRYPILIDGQEVDASACVMVPLRAVAEPLGFTVTWDGTSVLVDNGEIHTNVSLGVDRYVITTSHEDMVGMSAPFSLGTAPYAVDGTTYVPLGLFDALLTDAQDTIHLDDDQIVIQTQGTQSPDPFRDCGTLAEAEQAAGFSFQLPDRLPGWVSTPTIRAIPSSLIEVSYHGTDESLVLRKGPGSEDISGDYNTYPQVSTVEIGGRQVTVKGEGDTISTATWTDGEYSYAIHSTPGMDRNALSLLVEGMG